MNSVFVQLSFSQIYLAMDILFCIKHLWNAGVISLNIRIYFLPYSSLPVISIYHVYDFTVALVWHLSCPAGLSHPHSITPPGIIALLVTDISFQISSAVFLACKNGEIQEMTKAMTPICFCCHIVTSDCLSLRTWWAYSACDVERPDPALSTYWPSG